MSVPQSPFNRDIDPDKVQRDEFDVIDSILRSLQYLSFYKAVQKVAEQQAKPIPLDVEVVGGEENATQVEPPLELSGHFPELLKASPTHSVAGQTPTALQSEAQNLLRGADESTLAMAQQSQITIRFGETTLNAPLSEITAEKLKETFSQEGLYELKKDLDGNVMDAEVLDIPCSGTELLIDAEAIDPRVVPHHAITLPGHEFPQLRSVSVSTAERLVGQNPGESSAQNPEILVEMPTPVVLQDPKTGKLIATPATGSLVEGFAKETVSQTETEHDVMWSDIQSDRALEVDQSQVDASKVIGAARDILDSQPGGVFQGKKLSLVDTGNGGFQVVSGDRSVVFEYDGFQVKQNDLTAEDMGRFDQASQLIDGFRVRQGTMHSTPEIPVPNISSASSGVEIE